ncbi:MAG: hypothetical protein V3R85_04740 [Alphaproteobacteria bacterium]
MSAVRAGVLGAALFLVAGSAMAAEPVAIVEDVVATGAKVRFLDYLERGRRIDLGAKGRIVIGYLNSCLREEIVGGKIVIGSEQSTVVAGKIRRARVECDGGRLLLTAEQSGEGAAIVMRRVPPGSGAPVQASLRIYSLTPLFRFSEKASALTVERLDRPAPKLTLTVRGRRADTATNNMTLKRNGVYRVRAGKRTVVFRIDSRAVAGGPLLSRLVAF